MLLPLYKMYALYQTNKINQSINQTNYASEPAPRPPSAMRVALDWQARIALLHRLRCAATLAALDPGLGDELY